MIRSATAVAIALLAPGCGPDAAPAPKPAAPPAPTATSDTALPPPIAASRATPPPAPAPDPPARPCPDDMVFVDTHHCTQVSQRCLKQEYEKSNKLTICHRFAAGQTCTTPPRRQRYCIDPYEYPNEKGGHPPVLVSAYDAAAMCGERGKRLCYESEWTAACEGPDKLPFPYGLERSRAHCNIDNPYIPPSLSRAHSGNAAVQAAELRRLDQSVPSGSMETCRSGFGVHDLTGNFDEWVLSERPRGKSGWAGLKGGAWGHVRNACRPITTSHVPEFTYYFISFRCCRDADPAVLASLGDGGDTTPEWRPPPARNPKPARFDRGWSPQR